MTGASRAASGAFVVVLARGLAVALPRRMRHTVFSRTALRAASIVSGVFVVLAVGCGGSSSSGGGGGGGDGGGNPSGCPNDAPAAGSSCSLAGGTQCNYGCGNGGPAFATCSGNAWQVSRSNVACPAPVADGGAGCRSDKDCHDSSEYCATSTPGGITYCATSLTPKCNVDGDCADAGIQGTPICENYTCPSGTGRACFAGCSDADCGPTDVTGLVCGASHRCEAKSCNGPSDCPSNFDCTSNHCQRRGCTNDAQCNGFCVNGACEPSLGTCQLPRG